MAEDALRRKIEESIEDGFSPDEIYKALKQDGYSEKQIQEVLHEVRAGIEQKQDKNAESKNQARSGNERGNRENNTGSSQQPPENSGGRSETRSGASHGNQAGNPGHRDVISKIDFTDSEYTVKQKLVRNKYRVYNSEEELVLKAKQKLFKMKEEFPFTDAEGDPVFTIKAANVLDIAGDYALVDDSTDEKFAVLSKKFSFLKHIWKVKNPEGEIQATIESGSALLEMLRAVSDLLSFLPHSYTITDQDGRDIGSIEGRLSLRDTYDVTISRDAPFREAIVAAAVTIDALEGN